jgi:hypothetical protein
MCMHFMLTSVVPTTYIRGVNRKFLDNSFCQRLQHFLALPCCCLPSDLLTLAYHSEPGHFATVGKHLLTSVLRTQQMLLALVPDLSWHYVSSFPVQHISVSEKEKYLGSTEDMGQESYHYWSTFPTQQSRESRVIVKPVSQCPLCHLSDVIAIYHPIDMTVCLCKSVGSQLVHVERMCGTQFHVCQKKKSNQHTLHNRTDLFLLWTSLGKVTRWREFH